MTGDSNPGLTYKNIHPTCTAHEQNRPDSTQSVAAYLSPATV